LRCPYCLPIAEVIAIRCANAAGDLCALISTITNIYFGPRANLGAKCVGAAEYGEVFAARSIDTIVCSWAFCAHLMLVRTSNQTSRFVYGHLQNGMGEGEVEGKIMNEVVGDTSVVDVDEGKAGTNDTKIALSYPM